MTYNDGKPHDDFYLKTDEEKEKIALEFSEGNVELKELLLALWNSGVKTLSCCGGHPEKGENSSPYLFAEFPRHNTRLLHNIVTWIMSSEFGSFKISFTGDCDKLEFNIHTSEENKALMFSGITRVTNNNTQLSSHSELVDFALLFSDFSSKNQLSFRYAITKDEMRFFLVPSGYNNMFKDTDRNLEEEIHYLKTTGALRYASYKCNIESLRKFFSLLYPNDLVNCEQFDGSVR